MSRDQELYLTNTTKTLKYCKPISTNKANIESYSESIMFFYDFAT